MNRNRCISCLLGTLLLLAPVLAQDSLNVRRLGTYDAWLDDAWDVAFYGNTACVAMGEMGLVLVDVTDPVDPRWLSHYRSTTLPTVYDVAIIDHYAYAVGDGLLEVVDVSNPEAPALVMHHGGANYDARAIVVHDTLVYIGSTRHFHVVNASDPATPEYLASCRTDRRAAGMAVAGSNVYLATEGGRLLCINVSNPRQPSLQGWDYGNSANSGWGDVAAVDSHLCWAAGTGDLQTVRILPTGWLQAVTRLDLPGAAGGIWIRDTLAYVTTDSGGVRVVNISDPAAPVEVGTGLAPGATSIALAGNLAITAGHQGLHLLGTADPTAPGLLGRLNGPRQITSVEVRNGLVYVSDQGRGLAVLAAADPTNIRQIGELLCATANVPTDLDLFGHYAALSTGANTLAIVDVADPRAPVAAGSLGLGRVTELEVRAPWLYAMNPDSFAVINVATPQAPTLTGVYPLWTWSVGELDVRDNLACVPSLNWGLLLLDLSDPAAPDSITSHGLGPWYYASAFYAEDYLLVSYWDTLSVLSTAALPELSTVSRLALGGGLIDCFALSGSHVLVGTRDGRVSVVSLAAPAVTGYFDLGAPIVDLAIEGSRAYVSCGSALHVLDWSSALSAPPASATAPLPQTVGLAAYPNPFNPRTTISFDLPQTAHVKLMVYDLLGREVAVLENRTLAAGTYRVPFDGSALPTGVYLCRLHAGAVSETRKLLLLK